MKRLTDKRTAEALKHNADGLKAKGFDVPIDDLRYIKLAEYEARAEKMRDLLRESLPVLHRAFFANYKDTNAANELYDKIKAVVGGAE